LLGLTGSHRTGKSTLAKAFAEQNDMAFVDSGTTRIFERLGLKPGPHLPFEKRLEVQRLILEAFTERYAQQAASFITDRTPIDFAAYMLADVKGRPEEDAIEVMSYVADCIEVANTYFHTLVLVSPGIPYVEEDGKPPLDLGYQEQVHSLIAGFMCEPALVTGVDMFPRSMTDADERLEELTRIWLGIVQETSKALEDAVIN
jgi:predicted ATPase